MRAQKLPRTTTVLSHREANQRLQLSRNFGQRIQKLRQLREHLPLIGPLYFQGVSWPLPLPAAAARPAGGKAQTA